MNHPRNRAERRKISKKKHFDVDRAGHVYRKIEAEALEQKEILNELRREVHAQAETPLHRNPDQSTNSR